jgi:hypothetical protein
MQKYQNNVTNRKGDAISGASVTVTDSLGVLATIYSDDGVTVAANPMTTDAERHLLGQAKAHCPLRWPPE